jgi:hypothetical protein
VLAVHLDIGDIVLEDGGDIDLFAGSVSTAALRGVMDDG